MARLYEIRGAMEVPDDVERRTVAQAIIDLAESRGWFIHGSFQEIDEDGNAIWNALYKSDVKEVSDGR